MSQVCWTVVEATLRCYDCFVAKGGEGLLCELGVGNVGMS